MEPAQASEVGICGALEGLQWAELAAYQANSLDPAQHRGQAFVAKRFAEQESKPSEECRENA